MNAKVEEFIKKRKDEEYKKNEERILKEKKKRDEHLVSLGLVDENRTIYGRRYLDDWDGSKNCKYDKEKDQYYIEGDIPAPIEVTDEEYREILLYAPIAEENIEKATKSTWAKNIIIIANILLVLNIICILVFAVKSEWVYTIAAIVYCALYYPIAIGFSIIVAAAERKLEE